MLTSFSSALNKTLGYASQCSFCLQHKDTQAACCASCYALLVPEEVCRCQQCFLNIAEPGICGQCQTEPNHFDKIFCLGDYQWPLEPVIKNYKYAKQQHLVKPLSQLLWTQVEQHQICLPDVFCCVPLHWFKQWRRGFNQSELLCQQLAKLAQRPIEKVLSRPRYGSNQAGLNRRQRQRALTASFACKSTIKSAHWVLIDDVVTTGSTANTLAKLLKNAGANRVDIWAIARTPNANTSRADKKAVQ